MRPEILIIDDDPSFISKLRFAFKNFYFQEVPKWENTNKLLENHYDLILLDLKLEPNSDELCGLKYIKPLKISHPDTPLVVVTADEATETVVIAMKEGADDFLRKSEYDLLTWQKKFELLIENKRLARQIKDYEQEQFPFIGDSPEIMEIKKTLSILAENPEITVLLTGETGVGKEVAARYLHQQSKRKNAPFVAVNLSSIQETLIESALFGHKKGAFTGANYDREGYFRKANGGILFLDEIGDIDLHLQSKILRFLENKTINVVGDEKEIELDVQIIAATNVDLQELVEAGKFRADLYYRIKNFQIEIPPLRHRSSDIEKILNYYLKKAGYDDYDLVISKEAKEKLLTYEWPGNVRELQNAIDYMLLKARVKGKPKIDVSCLPEDIRVDGRMRVFSPAQEQEESYENSMQKKIALTELSEIESALKKTYGRKDAAAKLLGMNADQMRYRVLKWWKTNRQLVKAFPNIINKYNLADKK